MTGLRHTHAHTHALSMFSPIHFGIARNLAQNPAAAREAFAVSEICVSINSVANGSFPTRIAMCHYRYPSPIGRSDVPKIRPPALFPTSRTDLSQLREFGRFSACATRTLEHSLKLRVIQWTRINRGVTERCAEQKSHSLRPLPLARLRPAATRSANRPSWAARPGSAAQLSPAVMPAPAPLSARQPTSPTARPTPASAGRSTDLNHIRQVRLTVHKPVKPRSSTAATGFSRCTMPRTIRSQEPGQEPKRD